MSTNMENSNLISSNLRSPNCSTPPVMKIPKPRGLKSVPDRIIFPISNFPPVQNYDGGIPDDPTVVEIFSLRRELESMRQDLRAAHKKVTVALEALHCMRRYLRLGLFEKQWDTYDELKRRLATIEGTLQFLDDPLGGLEGGQIEIPNRWKKDKP